MSDGPLEQTNRFVVVIGALTVIIAALLVTLLAWAAPDDSISRISDFSGYLGRHNDSETKVIISLLTSVAVLVMLSVIVLEVTPPANQKMRVRSVGSGEAVITTSQIADRIDRDVSEVSHISRCAAVVVARGKRVEVTLDLDVDAGANLSDVADEACRRAHTLVESRLGIEMASRPRARLHYRELRLGEKPSQPLPQESRTPTGWERTQMVEGDVDQRG